MEKEQLIIAKVSDKIRKYEKTGVKSFTNFLDPSEIFEVRNMVNKLPNCFFGGFDEAERKILLIGSDEIAEARECIDVLTIESNENLTHRSVLGSILGLGINRDVVGDILIKENKVNVFVMKEITKYILQNLNKIGRIKVNVYKNTYDNLIEPENNTREIKTTVASLRLDAIISATLGIAREVASKMIQNQKVKLNYKLIENTSKQIKIGDIISVRGYGRIELIHILGETRKERIRIVVNKSL